MTKQQLQIQAYNLCSDMLTALLIGRFASIKFDTEERGELVESINRERQRITEQPTTELKQTILRLEEGLQYISSEAPNLESVPLGWITMRDIKYAMEARQA